MQCPVCLRTVEKGSRRCPDCGASMIAAVVTPTRTNRLRVVTCPVCLTNASEEDTACRSCGATLIDAVVHPTGTLDIQLDLSYPATTPLPDWKPDSNRVRVIRARRIACPVCLESTSDDRSFCPSCGAALIKGVVMKAAPPFATQSKAKGADVLDLDAFGARFDEEPFTGSLGSQAAGAVEGVEGVTGEAGAANAQDSEDSKDSKEEGYDEYKGYGEYGEKQKGQYADFVDLQEGEAIEDGSDGIHEYQDFQDFNDFKDFKDFENSENPSEYGEFQSFEKFENSETFENFEIFESFEDSETLETSDEFQEAEGYLGFDEFEAEAEGMPDYSPEYGESETVTGPHMPEGDSGDYDLGDGASREAFAGGMPETEREADGDAGMSQGTTQTAKRKSPAKAFFLFLIIAGVLGAAFYYVLINYIYPQVNAFTAVNLYAGNVTAGNWSAVYQSFGIGSDDAFLSRESFLDMMDEPFPPMDAPYGASGYTVSETDPTAGAAKSFLLTVRYNQGGYHENWIATLNVSYRQKGLWGILDTVEISPDLFMAGRLGVSAPSQARVKVDGIPLDSRYMTGEEDGTSTYLIPSLFIGKHVVTAESDTDEPYLGYVSLQAGQSESYRIYMVARDIAGEELKARTRTICLNLFTAGDLDSAYALLGLCDPASEASLKSTLGGFLGQSSGSTAKSISEETMNSQSSLNREYACSYRVETDRISSFGYESFSIGAYYRLAGDEWLLTRLTFRNLQ